MSTGIEVYRLLYLVSKILASSSLWVKLTLLFLAPSKAQFFQLVSTIMVLQVCYSQNICRR